LAVLENQRLLGTRLHGDKRFEKAARRRLGPRDILKTSGSNQS
jgi:hypothetical protein